jgi:rhomboid protease GluP
VFVRFVFAGLFRYNGVIGAKILPQGKRMENRMFVRRESLKQYVAWYPVTSLLIAVNVILVLLMEIAGSPNNSLTLLRFGAMFSVGEVEPEWWRYVTAIFLHAGWEHLLFNCFALYVFAAPLERMLGHVRYLMYYVLSGVIGNLASKLLHFNDYIGVGASGAIYGVYAAYVFIALFRKDLLDESSRKIIKIIVIVGFVHSLVMFWRVDLWAHLGGFVGGFVLMALIVLSIRARRQ